MDWFSLGIGIAGLGLVLVLATSSSERYWRLFQRPALLSFQLAGVVLATWLIITAAAAASEASVDASSTGLGPADTTLLVQPVASLVLGATLRTLLPVSAALAFASLAGLAGAMAVTTRERGIWSSLGPLATVLWTAPTFLIALLVQELQALITGRTGLVVAAGFGEVSGIQIFWVAVVLAVRPTAYFFQQARNALSLDVTTEYVRTARAKGLDWPGVVRRHIARANAPLILTAWLNSFRSMLGSLPLVEFLFGYPGLGRVLILSLGLSYGGGIGPVHADVAIALVVILGASLIAVETSASLLGRLLDPRLREIGPVQA